ncbi:MAG: CehA/McbA family metallohydrolase [Egibacteraceae bacterium]
MLVPTFHRRWTADDRAESVYQYVPFDVPSGAPAVSLRLEYDGTRAVLDLGLFDAERFRGYSGGARSEFVVTPSDATPGYLPGPLPAGTWRVLVGLHRIPPEGVDVMVTVETGAAWPIDAAGASFEQPESLPRGSTRRLPAAPGRRWIAGDLHAHTVHSDGALTIDQLADLAVRRGLDFLAVTDHNTVSHHPHLAAAGKRVGILLLPGQEVTTDTGHANCFGDVGWVDFRRPSDEWVAHAEAAGGLLSLNHPLAGDCAWRRPLSRSPSLIEAWHSSWDRRSDRPLRWWRARGGVPVGGSDWHRPGDPETLGCPTTWVEVTEELDMLGALRAGRVALSASPHSPVLLRHDGELVAVDAETTTIVGPDGRRTPIRGPVRRLPWTDGMHRLVDEDDRVVALVP